MSADSSVAVSGSGGVEDCESMCAVMIVAGIDLF
jgi:hypothetical protein